MDHRRAEIAVAECGEIVVEGELDQRIAGDERRGWHPLLDIPEGDGWIVQLSALAAFQANVVDWPTVMACGSTECSRSTSVGSST